MKKLLFAFAFSALLFACKQKDQKQQEVNAFAAGAAPMANDCSIFDTLQTMPLKDQVSWLKLNENLICLSQYDSCRVAAHRISQTVYNKGIEDFWGTRPVVHSQYTLGAIKELSKQIKYEDFIEAAADEQDTISLAVATDFTTFPNCYSVPLFYSIGRVKQLSESAIFIFTRAKINNTDTVVFTISGSSDFYDASHYPM